MAPRVAGDASTTGVASRIYPTLVCPTPSRQVATRPPVLGVPIGTQSAPLDELLAALRNGL